MAPKTVCPKHEVAHEVGQPCPWCDDSGDEDLEATVHQDDEPPKEGEPELQQFLSWYTNFAAD
jgi:hypothetical protein